MRYWARWPAVIRKQKTMLVSHVAKRIHTGLMMESTIDAALALARDRRRLPSPAARTQLRKRVGLSQRTFAEALGVTRVAVALWESGAREPRDENLRRYLELLDRCAREALR